ncbi:MAG: hypothetical protein AB8B79_14055 [Granulosicoccus sp.]
MQYPTSLMPFRSNSCVHSNRSRLSIAPVVLLMLSACGGGGGDASAPAFAAAVSVNNVVDVSQGDSSPLADAVETEALQEAAASNAAQGITVNLSAAKRINQDGNSLLASNTALLPDMLLDAGSLFSRQPDSQLLNDATGLELIQLDTGAIAALDSLLASSSSEQTQRVVEATLGLGENNAAQVQRNGNSITIDPDDVFICDSMLSDVNTSAAESVACQQVMSNLTVQLDAVTEQRGEITYLYSSQPLLGIAYGPLNASYTLNLGTLQEMERYSNQLSGGAFVDSDIQRVEGSVRMQSSVRSDREAEEAGNFRIELIEGLLISYADGGSLSMAPSLLISLDHDNDQGTASVEIELGATQFSGFAAEPFNVAFSGFTGRLDMDSNTGQFAVSRLGFVNGPLRIEEAGSFSVNLALQAFSFAFEERAEQLVFNSALNMILEANLLDSDFGNMSFSASLAGPAGTRLNAANESSSDRALVSGGPLQLDYSLSAAGSSESGFVQWNVNSCQSGSSVPTEQSLLLSVLGC